MIVEVIPIPRINKSRGYTEKKEALIPITKASLGYERYKYSPVPMNDKIVMIKTNSYNTGSAGGQSLY